MEWHLNLIPSNPAESGQAPADNVNMFNFYDSTRTQIPALLDSIVFEHFKVHAAHSTPRGTPDSLTSHAVKQPHIMVCQ